MATVDRKPSNKPPRKAPVTSEILDRQPPRSLEAEKAVLGSMLLLPSSCDEVSLIIRPDDFYDEANRKLFAHLTAINDAGKRVDMTLLVERLRTSNEYDPIGGAAYLAEIARSVPTAANAVHYAQIVRDKAVLRSLIESCTETLRDAYEDNVEAREQASRAEQRIFSVVDTRQHRNIVDAHELLVAAMERIEKRENGQHTIAGVDTGFLELDGLMGGLHNGELIILAARPSMGKTALALNIAEYVSCNLRVPTLVVSLEMSQLELADRLLCAHARVDGRKIRSSHPTKEDRAKLIQSCGAISDAPLYIDDSPTRTVTEIASTCRRLSRIVQKRYKGDESKKLGLVVVDYLQLIEPDNQKDQRQEQVARIARRLKGLARELKIPVLCLAQLNRQAEQGGSPIPRLSHLRESGAIEQDADVVMFVHRPEYYMTPEEREQAQQNGDSDGMLTRADIFIAKQRNGPTGDIKLLWQKEFTRFSNLAHKQYDEFEQFAPSGEPF
ncbi:MAG TPA: replicative DNA helicase [Pirellulales bacterium]|nr:replicative DNA helicase [Pirellulales bacterium]